MYKTIKVSHINPDTFLLEVEKVLNSKLECNVTFISSNIAYIIYKEVEDERVEPRKPSVSKASNTGNKGARKPKKAAK